MAGESENFDRRFEGAIMTIDQILFILMMIPLIAMWNHLGGQDTIIPNPRITCRVFGISFTVANTAFECGMPYPMPLIILAICIAGTSLWAPFKWGPGFMCFKTSTVDKRVYGDPWYNLNKWLTKFVDEWMGVNSLTVLSVPQIHQWGMIYMTLRGAMLYPLFAVLGIYLTPWAFLFGIPCLSQGIIYRLTPDVTHLEPKFGGVIGLMFVLVFAAHFLKI